MEAGGDGAPARPVVLVVEDDPSIRRFLEIALEELPVRVRACAGLVAARAALDEARGDGADWPVMAIVDQWLPDGLGVELVEEVRREPPPRGRMRMVAFSAGVDAALLARLERAGIDAVLPKPVPLARLEAEVRRALAGGTAAQAPARPPSAEADIVSAHFGGDRQLYEDYRAFCRERFPHDLAEGERALSGGDLPGLRRLAHSLAPVLRLLGREDGHRAARAVEEAAAAGDVVRTGSAWPVLARAIRDAETP